MMSVNCNAFSYNDARNLFKIYENQEIDYYAKISIYKKSEYSKVYVYKSREKINCAALILFLYKNKYRFLSVFIVLIVIYAKISMFLSFSCKFC